MQIITITTSGNDPFETLPFTAKDTESEIVLSFRNLAELTGRIATYPAMRADIQAKEDRDRAILEAVETLISDAAITDTAVPLEDTAVSTIEDANNQGRLDILTAKKADIESEIATLSGVLSNAKAQRV